MKKGVTETTETFFLRRQSPTNVSVRKTSKAFHKGFVSLLEYFVIITFC